MFFLSAFDRPFDKTADGMDLPTHVDIEGEPVEVSKAGVRVESAASPSQGGERIAAVSGGGVVGGGTIIIGGGSSAASKRTDEKPTLEKVNTEAIAAVSSSVATVSGTTEGQLPKMDPELEQATTDYVAELKRLTEMLSKVAEQSEKLGRNSEEMDNLDRTLTGICKVYEMQLKSASAQIGTIDEINDQTKKMARQIEELNRIYTRMIEAMTVNMPAARCRPSAGFW